MKTLRNEAAMQVEQIDAYEALVQFLYRAPIGLVQTDLAGTVDMLNPMASNLLMPLARDGGLDNLFAVLDAVAPQVRQMAGAFDEPSGVVCDALRVPPGRPGAPGAPQVLSISLMKLDAERLMAAISDATFDAQREQETLRRAPAQRRPHRRADAPAEPRGGARPAAGPARPAWHGAIGDSFALLFLNCDRFRQINDTLGQAAGDRLLGSISDRLLTALADRMRAGGLAPNGRIDPSAGGAGLVARVGGDEFVVLLDGLRHPDEAERLAVRLLDALARPHELDGAAGGLPRQHRRAVGRRRRRHARRTPTTRIRDASIAMIEAKRAGGARHVVFERAMRERAERRADIEAAAAPGPGRGAAVRRLPAGGRAGPGRRHRPLGRRRGAGALAASDARPGAALRLHRRGRGMRPDRPDRRLRARARLPRFHALAARAGRRMRRA